MTTIAAAAGLDVTAAPATARNRHPLRVRPALSVRDVAADASKRPPIPYAYSFYPQEIEGGVSGNLPFNNQIRKFKDPLNANGGGG